MLKDKDSQGNEMKCKRIWQPNFDDSKSIKKGYVWKCYCCGRVRKTTPKEMK